MNRQANGSSQLSAVNEGHTPPAAVTRLEHTPLSDQPLQPTGSPLWPIQPEDTMTTGPPPMLRPEVLVLELNETLSDLEPMRERFEQVGLPRHALDVWFAATLRDGFA
jgi:hypothetical protein